VTTTFSLTTYATYLFYHLYRSNYPQIADIFLKIAPFFKIFKEYARNIEGIKAKYDKWNKKYPVFYKVLGQFEVRC